ncbi:MAG: hypothetical protein HY979_02665 [Candidatus Magasanikbacteria bacterium]|nr:hypothetical protein [Candidatus Magasanikbacteria bacterium]
MTDEKIRLVKDKITRAQSKEAFIARWYEMTLCEQMGNIGSEVGRAHNWQKKNNIVQRDKSLDRAFDLLDITLDDPRWRVYPGRLREICLARELLADTFWGSREHGDTAQGLEKYFFQFALAARAGK